MSAGRRHVRTACESAAMTIETMPDTGRLAGIITATELAKAGPAESKINILVRRGTLTRCSVPGYYL
jgi:hypothetical protein